MISSLTPAQEAKIGEYLQAGLDRGRRTSPVSLEQARESVSFLYNLMNKQTPKHILLLDSPMACQLAINMIKGDSQLESQLWSQLRSQLWSQLRRQLGSQLGNQLGSQLRSQLESQLYNQLRSQLESQLGSQLGNQLDLKHQNLTSSVLWDYWYVYYSYILNELFPKRKNEFKLLAEYLEYNSNLHMCWLYDDIAFVSQFPKSLHVDDIGALHHEEDKATEYADGWGFYANHGEVVSSKLELVLT
jgi:hypothetical protein